MNDTAGYCRLYLYPLVRLYTDTPLSYYYEDAAIVAERPRIKNGEKYKVCETEQDARQWREQQHAGQLFADEGARAGPFPPLAPGVKWTAVERRRYYREHLGLLGPTK